MSENGADAQTVGEYLQVLLETLWINPDNFSGTRPFGASSWPYELYEALIQGGFVEGVFDEEGFLDEFSDTEMEKADDLIIQAIDHAFKPWHAAVEEDEDEDDGELYVEDPDDDEEDSVEVATIMNEETEDLSFSIEEEDGAIQVVAFVEAPEDEDDAFEAPPTGISAQGASDPDASDETYAVPDSVPDEWLTDAQESLSIPRPEDQRPADSP